MADVRTVIPDGLLDGWHFDLIHIVGLASLSISCICCLIVLFLTFVYNTEIKSVKAFFGRPVGERLVVYLVICNLLYSISHIMDHSYMIAVRGNPPNAACAAFAFFLNEFVLAQSVIVGFTAINAFVMVVKKIRVPLGKYDWGMGIVSLGVPLVIGILGLSTGHFGPTGPWCYMDHRTALGPILTNIVGVLMIVTFTFNIFCYSAVWITLRRHAQRMGQEGDNKYTRSARNMMMFLVVYPFQWWAYLVYCIWLLIGNPHIIIKVCAVSFSNMGGMFNLITYVLLQRQKKARVADKPHGNTTQHSYVPNTDAEKK